MDKTIESMLLNHLTLSDLTVIDLLALYGSADNTLAIHCAVEQEVVRRLQ